MVYKNTLNCIKLDLYKKFQSGTGRAGCAHCGLKGGMPGVRIQAFQSTLFRMSTWEKRIERMLV